jgi:Mg2+-importing ATPase
MQLPVVRLLERLATTPAGLSSAEAIRRLDEHGPNTVAESSSWSPVRLVARAVLNPLVMLLGVLAVSALLTGDPASAAIMLVMLAIGVGLRFIQESHASAAAADLQTMIRVHATALRDGRPVEVPIAELVPGDIIHLAAGDMVPADLRLLSSKDLFVSQATLTGESFPVEKFAADAAAGGTPLELTNVCWLGTSVESGTAEAVVVATGRQTLLGGVSRSLEEPEPPTAFDIGMARFTWR